MLLNLKKSLRLVLDYNMIGYCPTEAEIQEVLRDMEDPQEMGYISVDRFYPVMSKIIMQQR